MKTKFDCTGTRKEIAGKFYDCLGNGYVATKTEIREFDPSQEMNNEIFSTLCRVVRKDKEPGVVIEEMKKRGPVRWEHPIAFARCPCLQEQDDSKRHSWLKQKFGVVKEHELTLAQLTAFQNYKAKRSVYIWGQGSTGKSFLAWYIAKEYSGQKIEVFVGKEYGDMVREAAVSGKRHFAQGLLVLDDADKDTPSDFLEKELWHVVDLAYKNKLSIVMTSNKPPSGFAEKFAASSADTMERRIHSAMEVVELKA